MNFAQDSLTDWIKLGFAVIAGIYALYLFRQSNQDKRIRYVGDILNRLYDDPEIRIIIYSVDKGEDLNEIRFGGKLEKQADKTIQYFNYIGYLIHVGNLKRRDIKPFTYEINRVITNKRVRDYIEHLRNIEVPLEYLNHIMRSNNTDN